MADNFKFAQLQNFSLAGAGAIIGDTSIVLKSMKDIDGNAITMTGAFGTIGFGTLEPGNSTSEEQISFTGITNNANGTSTLTGVKSVTFLSPYTATSGLLKTHAGSTTFIISNTSGFYDNLSGKADDETITGTWVFPSADPTRAGIGSDTDTAVATAFVTLGQLSRQAIAGAADASETVKGLVQIATTAQINAGTLQGSTSPAYLVINPSPFSTSIFSTQLPGANEKAALNATTSPSASNVYITQTDEQKASVYSAATTGSANNYLITINPSPVAYTDGMIVQAKASFTNNASARINVNGLGLKTIKKLDGATDLISGDIVSGQEVSLKYDGTNFQMLSPSAITPLKTIFLVGSGGGNYTTSSAARTVVDSANLATTLTGYASGQKFLITFRAQYSATGSPTLLLRDTAASATVFSVTASGGSGTYIQQYYQPASFPTTLQLEFSNSGGTSQLNNSTASVNGGFSMINPSTVDITPTTATVMVITPIF